MVRTMSDNAKMTLERDLVVTAYSYLSLIFHRAGNRIPWEEIGGEGFKRDVELLIARMRKASDERATDPAPAEGAPFEYRVCSITGKPWLGCGCGDCERGVSTSVSRQQWEHDQPGAAPAPAPVTPEALRDCAEDYESMARTFGTDVARGIWLEKAAKLRALADYLEARR